MTNKKYVVQVHYWDPIEKGGFEESDDQSNSFETEDEAYEWAFFYALRYLSELNDSFYQNIDAAYMFQENCDFRIDIDGEDTAIIRKWDGDDYWPVATYNIKEI